MASRYQIIECPHKQAEYRKAGMLFYRYPGNAVWWDADGARSVDSQKTLMNRGYKYAILVEEDDSPTNGDNGG